MILALLTPFFGLLGSLIPGIVRLFERRQEIKYEIEITRIKIEAAREQTLVQRDIEGIKADVAEGESIRSHDKSLDGGKFINALRASIRPVITYTFFTLFLIIKLLAFVVMIETGASVPETLRAIWDPETMALFSTIIAFWFGTRALDKMNTYNRIDYWVEREQKMTPPKRGSDKYINKSS